MCETPKKKALPPATLASPHSYCRMKYEEHNKRETPSKQLHKPDDLVNDFFLSALISPLRSVFLLSKIAYAKSALDILVHVNISPHEELIAISLLLTHASFHENDNSCLANINSVCISIACAFRVPISGRGSWNRTASRVNFIRFG